MSLLNISVVVSHTINDHQSDCSRLCGCNELKKRNVSCLAESRQVKLAKDSTHNHEKAHHPNLTETVNVLGLFSLVDQVVARVRYNKQQNIFKWWGQEIVSGPRFCLSARSGFQGAALADCSELGDHICCNVFVAAEDSGDKSVNVCVCVWWCAGVC